MTIVGEREELRGLVDKLPDSEIPAATRFLRYLCLMAEDPVLRTALEAPLDDEPLTPEQDARIREAEAAAGRGEVVTQAEVRRELGL